MTQMENNLQSWHKIVKENDQAELAKLIAPNAVFHSPVLEEPQKGKELVLVYLGAASRVLGPTIKYVRELTSATDAFLEFTAQLGAVEINGIDMIQWNADGQITDFKVMVRPLPAIETLKKRMKRQLVKMAREARDKARE